MNLIPILVGAFGRKWRRRKNVNLALNNIPPFHPPHPLPLYSHRKRRYTRTGKEKREGAKKRKGSQIKHHVRQDREKRQTVTRARRRERGMGSEKRWRRRRCEVGRNNEGGRGRGREMWRRVGRITGNELLLRAFYM